MPGCPALRPTFARIRRPAPAGRFAAAALVRDAGPARAEGILPVLTSFTVSATSVDVTRADAPITVTMSVSDTGAAGAGTGYVIAHGPTRAHSPFGRLVQVGGTATDAQYRADITLPAGKAVPYRLDISFAEAGPSGLAALRSQLAASGWPYHVRASVTPAPATSPAPAKSAAGPEPGAVTAPRGITARAGQGAGRRRLQGRDFPQ